MRRYVNSANAVVALVGQRGIWDAAQHQAESLFMDRKDFEQMYPTRKPRTTGGGYGYHRNMYWGMFLSPNPAVRLPHERRRLNPKPAKVVTVFGASGFLGSRIAKELIAHPKIEKVRLCTRYPMLIKEGSDLDLLLKEGGDKVELHECDVTDRIQVNVASNGADTLIFALDYHSEYANNSHMDTFVTGASNVGWTARNVRAERVIHVTGLDATFASESNYVDMRCRGEDACGANFPDATLIRHGPLYGNGMRTRGLGKYLYGCAFQDTVVQPTWVTDAARAVVRCCFAQRAIRYKLDLGGPNPMSHYQYQRARSRLYDSRVVFKANTSVAMFLGRWTPWMFANPWFDYDWILTWELDQVNRNTAMFDRLASWERLEYTPHTMDQAAKIDSGEEKLTPGHVLDEEYLKIEMADLDAFKAEEEMSKKLGVHRGMAEPAFGRGDGMEALAQEIYPGHQFRIKPLEGAKYPKQVKNPGPVAIM